MHVSTHLYYVVARSHLNGKEHAFVAVTLDVFAQLWIFSFYRGNILQAHDVAFHVGIDYLFCHITLVVVRVCDVYGQVQIGLLQTSTNSSKALQGKIVQNLVRTDTVSCQLVLVKADAYLLVLQSVGAEVGDSIYTSQTVLQPVDIGIQFAIGLLLAFNRDEQGRCVGYVIHSLQGKHARRQGGFEGLQSMLELAPEGIPILHVVVEFEEYYQHSVLALGVGLLLIHLLVSEDEILQRLCHTLFHLV